MASSYGTPSASGTASVGPAAGSSPSGHSPRLAGSGQMKVAVGTTTPAQTVPRITEALEMPRWLINVEASGVNTRPPAEMPVDAIDSATDRRRWNQRVTTVVHGTRKQHVLPTASRASTR